MFESKSQIKNGNYNCVDIAGHMYLWTPTGNSKPSRLIITAHGMRPTSSKFTVRNSTLNFYSDDRYSVYDPGLRDFYMKKHNAVPKESIAPGSSCYNYILTKYTNSERNKSHNKGTESYNVVQDLMQEDFEGRALELRAAANTMPHYAQGFRRDAAKHEQIGSACILTIRYRRFRTYVTLKWALKELEKKGYTFNQVDCLFCRNNLWTGTVGGLIWKFSQGVTYN